MINATDFYLCNGAISATDRSYARPYRNHSVSMAAFSAVACLLVAFAGGCVERRHNLALPNRVTALAPRNLQFGWRVYLTDARTGGTKTVSVVLRCSPKGAASPVAKASRGALLIIASLYLQHAALDYALERQPLPPVRVYDKNTPRLWQNGAAGWVLARENWEFSGTNWSFYFDRNSGDLAWVVKGEKLITIIHRSGNGSWRCWQSRLPICRAGTVRKGWNHLNSANFRVWSAIFFSNPAPLVQSLQGGLWHAFSGRGNGGDWWVTKIILTQLR